MEHSDIIAPSQPPTIGKALWEGGVLTIRYWKVVLIYWLVGLLLALAAALPLRSTLLHETGSTLLLDELIAGFNYTYLNDFLQNYGSALTPLLNQSLLMLLLHFFVLIFLTAGLANILVQRPRYYNTAVFWGGGGVFFGRMLRLSLFFLLMHALILVVFGWLYLKVTKGLSPANLENEAIITSSLRWLVPLYVLTAAVPMLWQDYAKIQLIKLDSPWIWGPIFQAARFICQHFLRVYGLYILLLSIALGLLGLNYFLQVSFAVQSFGTILLSLLLGQLFVMVRYALKVWNLGSASYIFTE